MKDNLKPRNIIDRVTDDLPDYWRRVRKAMMGIGIAGTAIIGAAASIPASIVVIPAIVTTIAGYMIAIGAVGTALSSTASTDRTGNDDNLPIPKK